MRRRGIEKERVRSRERESKQMREEGRTNKGWIEKDREGE